MRSTRGVIAAATWVAAACAGPRAAESGPRASPNVLTQTQLAATNSENLYDAITKLRPSWLTNRGPTSVTDATPASVSVFMNGSMLGKADYLRQVALLDVTEVRYWDPGQASARFGMGHPRGV